jgi:hypothetical protein
MDQTVICKSITRFVHVVILCAKPSKFELRQSVSSDHVPRQMKKIHQNSEIPTLFGGGAFHVANASRFQRTVL